MGGLPRRRSDASFGAGLGFIHNIPPPPPSGWTARPGQLELRPHTALFTEGRFRAPRGDNQHGSAGERDRAAGPRAAAQPLFLWSVTRETLSAPGRRAALIARGGVQIPGPLGVLLGAADLLFRNRSQFKPILEP